MGERGPLEIKKPKGRGREAPPSSVEKVSLLLCAIFSRECEDIGITITGFRPDSFFIQDVADCNIIFPNQNNVVYLHQKYFDIYTNT